MRDGDVAVAQLGENGMSLALHLCALIADRAVPLGSAAFTIQKLCTPPALGRERPTSVSAPAELPHFDAAELAGGAPVLEERSSGGARFPPRPSRRRSSNASMGTPFKAELTWCGVRCGTVECLARLRPSDAAESAGRAATRERKPAGKRTKTTPAAARATLLRGGSMDFLPSFFKRQSAEKLAAAEASAEPPATTATSPLPLPRQATAPRAHLWPGMKRPEAQKSAPPAAKSMKETSRERREKLAAETKTAEVEVVVDPIAPHRTTTAPA